MFIRVETSSAFPSPARLPTKSVRTPSAACSHRGIGCPAFASWPRNWRSTRTPYCSIRTPDRRGAARAAAGEWHVSSPIASPRREGCNVRCCCRKWIGSRTRGRSGGHAREAHELLDEAFARAERSGHQSRKDAAHEPRIDRTNRGSVIELHGVCKSFGRKEVLRGVDLSVPPGQTFAFLGRNGAWKTNHHTHVWVC